MRMSLFAAASAALILASCNVAVSPSGQSEEQRAAEHPSRPSPLSPSGPPAALSVDQGDEGLQWAASVVRLDPIANESAKLFGTAGGDPAMNGLYTYIAFFPSAAEGWQVYRIGDFLDYAILSQTNGRVDLEIEESTMDQANGNIGSRKRKIIVQWTQGANDTAPTSVTVTPAD